MYLRFYGLRDYPFAITPDPAFLYLSGHHREALGHLLYGTGEHGGFVQLTGEVGTGKTTLIRTLLEQERPELDVALCLNPRLTVAEFVAEVCDELGVTRAGGDADSLKTLVDALNAHLLETHSAGRRTVLIVDEAQNLSRDVLEQLRLLTNLETHTHKLMRIILVGQPELETLLRRPDLRQLAQRITARYHLRALNRAETTAYIRHRLQVAGGNSDIFTDSACGAAYACTGGVPRLINTVCERALMGGYSQGRRRIGPRMLRRAAREVLPGVVQQPPRRWGMRLVPAAALLAAVGLGFALHYGIDRMAVEGDSAPVRTASASASDDGDKTASASNSAGQSPQSPDAGKASAAKKADEDGGASSPDAGAENGAQSAPDDEPAQRVARTDSQTDDAKPDKASASSPKAEPAPEPLPRSDADITQLLRLWGVFGEPVDAPCWELAVGDLRCVRIDGTFADLKRFNRPALLELSLEDGKTRHVLLSSLDKSQATLVFGEGTRRIARERLAGLWTGQARLIWRQPIAVRNVRSGSVGSAVVWVRRQLARVEGIDLDNRAGQPSPVYDEALAEKIKAFQRKNNLKVDGVIGPRTIMALNNREPAAGTPFLVDRSNDGD